GHIGLQGWIYTYTEYDSQGRAYRTSLPTYNNKRWNTTSYDSYGRPNKITEASGAITNYSYSGNSVTVSKAGRSSTKTSNARGDLISASDPGGTISYVLRGDGQPSRIIAPGGIVTSFTYDGYGRKTAMTDPSAGTITYQYDSSGNLYRQTNANNKVTTRTFDTYNRLISEASPEISTTYFYNSDGLVTGRSSNNGTSTAYTYNNLLQLTGFSETVDGHTYSEAYNYSNGRLNSTTYGAMNYTINYHYNSNQLLTAIKNGNTNLWTLSGQDAFGNVTNQMYGNGVRVQQGFDSYGFPTEIKATKTSTSAILQHFGYSFNTTTGNLTSRSDQRRNMTESFEYDNLDRLTHCTAFGNAFETQYHANGNIKSHAGIGTYQYLSNKPYAVKSVEDVGNVIPQHRQTISY
ncbi:MAG: endonuclease, partial [Bacteroidales bacterium]|nr:endonuclease [Bacteroidales bacterium]